ncbi:MAG: SRPBCC domain-containing protein [Aestuariibacter sp.]
MHEIELQGTFLMPIDKLWQKWTEPEQMMSWFQPAGMRLNQVMRDLREQGKYRFRFSAPDGSEQVLHGTYQEVEEEQKLAFSWQWQDEDHCTEVSITFVPSTHNGCDLSIKHSGFWDEEDRQLHEQAWLGCLERLSISSTTG